MSARKKKKLVLSFLRVIDVFPQDVVSRGVAQFSQCLRLNLSNSIHKRKQSLVSPCGRNHETVSLLFGLVIRISALEAGIDDFDGSSPLASDRKVGADFFQCFRLAVVKSKAHSDYISFARIQCV